MPRVGTKERKPHEEENGAEGGVGVYANTAWRFATGLLYTSHIVGVVNRVRVFRSRGARGERSSRHRRQQLPPIYKCVTKTLTIY